MSVRVLSANLWNGRGSPAALRALIDAEEPDMVAIQELAPNLAPVLETRFEHSLLEPREDALGTGLATRHASTLSRHPVGELTMLSAVLEPADWPALSRPLRLTSVHIQSPLVTPLRESSRLRRKQVDRVLELANGPPSAQVFVGDFNSTPIWRTYRRIAAKVDDLARSGPGLPRRTWGPTARSPRLLRIDHAFGCGVEARRVRVVRIQGSDHSALMLDLEVTG